MFLASAMICVTAYSAIEAGEYEGTRAARIPAARSSSVGELSNLITGIALDFENSLPGRTMQDKLVPVFLQNVNLVCFNPEENNKRKVVGGSY